MAKTQKKKTSDSCSRYIRLRDALEYCKKMHIDTFEFGRIEDLPVKCCTCNTVKPWIRGDAGHFIGRGVGGHSGVYFDERNIHFQCKQCNGFRDGNTLNYENFMIEKYGQDVITELRWLDIHNSYKGKLIGLELYYKEAYQKLVKGAS